MNAPKQLRGTVTRTKLIVAAINLLANEGYAATTMAKVAINAEVSHGPRQYYFPTPISLFRAVVEHILEFQHMDAESLEGVTDTRAYVSKRFQSKLKGIGSPGYRAIVELKMACRGDRALNDAIGSAIQASEARADASFMAHFAKSGLSEVELLAVRGILISASSGLAISQLAEERPDVAQMVQKLLPELLAAYVDRRPIVSLTPARVSNPAPADPAVLRRKVRQA